MYVHVRGVATIMNVQGLESAKMKTNVKRLIDCHLGGQVRGPMSRFTVFRLTLHLSLVVH